MPSGSTNTESWNENMRTDRPPRRQARGGEWAKHLRPEGKRRAAKTLRRIRRFEVLGVRS